MSVCLKVLSKDSGYWSAADAGTKMPVDTGAKAAVAILRAVPAETLPAHAGGVSDARDAVCLALRRACGPDTSRSPLGAASEALRLKSTSRAWEGLLGLHR